MPRHRIGDLKVMSFGEHLEELRARIIRSLLLTLVFTAIALGFQDQLMRIVSGPHQRAMSQVQGRRLAHEVADRLGTLRTKLLDVPQREGGAAVAEEEQRAAILVRIEEVRGGPAEEPLASAIADLLLLEEKRSITGTGITGRLARISEDLTFVEGHHAWGAADSLDDAHRRLEGIQSVIALWRAEAVDPSPGERPSPDTAREVLREVDDELSALSELTLRLRYYEDEKVPLRLLSYTEAFFSHLKVAFLVGLLIGLPWITYEIWLFIAAGLYQNERSAVAPFLPFSLMGLVLGGTFAYFVLIPVGLTYLGSYGDPELVDPDFTLTNYLSLVFTLLIGMGLVFQLPLVMVFLSRSGMVTPEQMRQHQRFAILGSLIIGAFLTPPDVVTQLLMAVPMILLYQAGIWASFWFRRRAVTKESEEP